MILLDTHAFLWLANDSRKLGRVARRTISQATSRREVSVCAISYWELSTLLAAGRVRMHVELEQLRDTSRRSGILEIAIDSDIAIIAGRLQGLHGDPADRLIVAAALATGATLLTADEKLLALRGGPACIDAQS